MQGGNHKPFAPDYSLVPESRIFKFPLRRYILWGIEMAVVVPTPVSKGMHYRSQQYGLLRGASQNIWRRYG